MKIAFYKIILILFAVTSYNSCALYPKNCTKNSYSNLTQKSYKYYTNKELHDLFCSIENTANSVEISEVTNEIVFDLLTFRTKFLIRFLEKNPEHYSVAFQKILQNPLLDENIDFILKMVQHSAINSNLKEKISRDLQYSIH